MCIRRCTVLPSCQQDPALEILEKWKLQTEVIEIVKKLHEHIRFRVKGKEGLSDDWLPARGLREGCATSPILFNIYHSEAIRMAQRDRETEAAKRNLKYGLKGSWIPGNSFPPKDADRCRLPFRRRLNLHRMVR